MRASSLFLPAPLAHHVLGRREGAHRERAAGRLVGRSAAVPCLGLAASNGLALILCGEERGRTRRRGGQNYGR